MVSSLPLCFLEATSALYRSLRLVARALPGPGQGPGPRPEAQTLPPHARRPWAHVICRSRSHTHTLTNAPTNTHTRARGVFGHMLPVTTGYTHSNTHPPPHTHINAYTRTHIYTRTPQPSGFLHNDPSKRCLDGGKRLKTAFTRGAHEFGSAPPTPT